MKETEWLNGANPELMLRHLRGMPSERNTETRDRTRHCGKAGIEDDDQLTIFGDIDWVLQDKGEFMTRGALGERWQLPTGVGCCVSKNP